MKNDWVDIEILTFGNKSKHGSEITRVFFSVEKSLKHKFWVIYLGYTVTLT